jgi:hypothetical protein
MAYKRCPSCIQVNLSLDTAAMAILRQYAGSNKTIGRLISRLAYEFAAKEEERQRIAQQMQAVLQEPSHV